MKTFEYLWTRIMGALIAIIGVVHCVFTPATYHMFLKIVAPTITSEMARGGALRFAYFFALAGVMAIFAGLLMIYASFGLKKSEGWARVISSSASWLMVLFGISAMAIIGKGNFLVWIMTGAAITSGILLLIGPVGARESRTQE